MEYCLDINYKGQKYSFRGLQFKNNRKSNSLSDIAAAIVDSEESLNTYMELLSAMKAEDNQLVTPFDGSLSFADNVNDGVGNASFQSMCKILYKLNSNASKMMLPLMKIMKDLGVGWGDDIYLMKSKSEGTSEKPNKLILTDHGCKMIVDVNSPTYEEDFFNMCIYAIADKYMYNRHSGLELKTQLDAILDSNNPILQELKLDCVNFSKGLKYRYILNYVFNVVDVDTLSPDNKAAIEEIRKKIDTTIHMFVLVKINELTDAIDKNSKLESINKKAEGINLLLQEVDALLLLKYLDNEKYKKYKEYRKSRDVAKELRTDLDKKTIREYEKENKIVVTEDNLVVDIDKVRANPEVYEQIDAEITAVRESNGDVGEYIETKQTAINNEIKLLTDKLVDKSKKAAAVLAYETEHPEDIKRKKEISIISPAHRSQEDKDFLKKYNSNLNSYINLKIKTPLPKADSDRLSYLRKLKKAYDSYLYLSSLSNTNSRAERLAREAAAQHTIDQRRYAYILLLENQIANMNNEDATTNKDYKAISDKLAVYKLNPPSNIDTKIDEYLELIRIKVGYREEKKQVEAIIESLGNQFNPYTADIISQYMKEKIKDVKHTDQAPKKIKVLVGNTEIEIDPEEYNEYLNSERQSTSLSDFDVTPSKLYESIANEDIISREDFYEIIPTSSNARALLFLADHLDFLRSMCMIKTAKYEPLLFIKKAILENSVFTTIKGLENLNASGTTNEATDVVKPVEVVLNAENYNPFLYSPKVARMFGVWIKSEVRTKGHVINFTNENKTNTKTTSNVNLSSIVEKVEKVNEETKEDGVSTETKEEFKTRTKKLMVDSIVSDCLKNKNLNLLYISLDESTLLSTDWNQIQEIISDVLTKLSEKNIPIYRIMVNAITTTNKNDLAYGFTERVVDLAIDNDIRPVVHTLNDLWFNSVFDKNMRFTPKALSVLVTDGVKQILSLLGDKESITIPYRSDGSIKNIERLSFYPKGRTVAINGKLYYISDKQTLTINDLRNSNIAKESDKTEVGSSFMHNGEEFIVISKNDNKVKLWNKNQNTTTNEININDAFFLAYEFLYKTAVTKLLDDVCIPISTTEGYSINNGDVVNLNEYQIKDLFLYRAEEIKNKNSELRKEIPNPIGNMPIRDMLAYNFIELKATEYELDETEAEPEDPMLVVDGMKSNFESKTGIKIEINRDTNSEVNGYLESDIDGNPVIVLNNVTSETFIHEFSHVFIEYMRVKNYGKYAEFLLNCIDSIGADKFEEMVAKVKNSRGISYALALEEVLADIFGALFSDKVRDDKIDMNGIEIDASVIKAAFKTLFLLDPITDVNVLMKTKLEDLAIPYTAKLKTVFGDIKNEWKKMKRDREVVNAINTLLLGASIDNKSIVVETCI